MSIRSTVALLCISAATLGAQAAPAAPEQPKMLEGSLSLGFSRTSGNANATSTNITNKLKYTLTGWAVSQDLVFFYGEAEQKVNANFWSGGLRAERRLTARLGIYVVTRFDRNVLQGIARRFEEGVGLDYKVLDGKVDKFNIALGASAFQQTLTPGSSSAFGGSFPAARAAGDYKHMFVEHSFFQQTVEYLPNVRETKSYLLNTESAVVAPLMKTLAVKVGYVVRFNSQPPVRDGLTLKKTDTYLSSGLTYSF